MVRSCITHDASFGEDQFSLGNTSPPRDEIALSIASTISGKNVRSAGISSIEAPEAAWWMENR